MKTLTPEQKENRRLYQKAWRDANRKHYNQLSRKNNIIRRARLKQQTQPVRITFVSTPNQVVKPTGNTDGLPSIKETIRNLRFPKNGYDHNH